MSGLSRQLHLSEHFRRDGKAKASYGTREDAASFCERRPLDHLHPYLCKTCGRWHVGH